MTKAEQEWSLIEAMVYCKGKRLTKKSCAGCPYAGAGCAIDATIAKLKAQEPRVMTLWEAVGIIDRPVYLERNVLMPDKSVNRQECWALVCATDDEHMIRLATPYGEEKWHVGAYGIGWRCWTSRPTDAQREKVKWE